MTDSTEPSNLSHFWPLLNIVVSAIVSWITASYIARRGVKKQAFSDLLRRLDEIEEQTEALYLVPGSSAEAASYFRAVTRHDLRIGERLTEFFSEHKSRSRLAGRDPIPPQITKALNDLRAIACADELVAANRGAFPANDQRFQQLRAAVERLRRAIRDEARDMKADHLQA